MAFLSYSAVLTTAVHDKNELGDATASASQHAGVGSTVRARVRPLRPRTSSLARLIVALAVVVAGGGLIVVRSVESARVVPRVLEPAVRAEVEDYYDHFRCLEQQLDRHVRPGARLLVVADDPESYQRLVEIATPRARLVESRRSATAVASFARTTTEPSCDGWKVEVRRL